MVSIALLVVAQLASPFEAAPAGDGGSPTFEATVAAGKVAIYRTDTFADSAPHLLVLETKSARSACPLDLELDCSDGVEAEQRGDLLLVCLPRFGRRTDACLFDTGNAPILRGSRACVLVDLARRECVSLRPFAGAKLAGPSTLLLTAYLSEGWTRLPASLEELADPLSLGCPPTGPLGLLTPPLSRGLGSELRVRAGYFSGRLTLREWVGAFSTSESAGVLIPIPFTPRVCP